MRRQRGGGAEVQSKPHAKLRGKQVQDYFTPVDYACMDCDDSDLAAGGLPLIPATSQALADGKMGKL
jgi:hypothetical protein